MVGNAVLAININNMEIPVSTEALIATISAAGGVVSTFIINWFRARKEKRKQDDALAIEKERLEIKESDSARRMMDDLLRHAEDLRNTSKTEAENATMKYNSAMEKIRVLENQIISKDRMIQEMTMNRTLIKTPTGDKKL